MEQDDADVFFDEVPEFGVGPDTKEISTKWCRPPPPKFDPEKDSLIFQQIEIDHYNGK